MNLSIREIDPSHLPLYASIPIAYQVRSILQPQLIHGGLGGITLTEINVTPYIKDYDAYPDGSPEHLPAQFDMTNWGLFLAYMDEQPAGGAILAFDTPGVHMLSARRDLSALWDIRVHPNWRGQGIGKALFQHAAGWSKTRCCCMMKVETQNVNLPACRFYQRMGCTLCAFDRFAYSSVPHVAHEIMMLWCLEL